MNLFFLTDAMGVLSQCELLLMERFGVVAAAPWLGRANFVFSADRVGVDIMSIAFGCFYMPPCPFGCDVMM